MILGKTVTAEDIGKRKVRIIKTGKEGTICSCHTSYYHSSWIKIKGDPKQYLFDEFELI